MSTGPQPFDPATRYFKLDDDGKAHEVEVDAAFWAEIDRRPDFTHGRLVMVAHFAADWPTWEIHPAGDERVPMRAGSSCVVPANTWHTARVAAPCSAQFITPCRGTRNAATPD